jgi:FAD/FMN-containing dehydrogenase/Fe-S oxidoreductase
MQAKLKALEQELEGEFYADKTMRTLYATDASPYQEMPLAVAMPRTVADIKKLIAFANRENTSLIPRTAGTSLAGQCVGSGIVVDVSKHFNKILEVNKEEKWVRLQPGVVLDELNKHLETFGLFFGPETSTANRCMIGGMVGNNACGSHSVLYGSTRDHLLSLKTILSDGAEVEFGALTQEAFEAKCQGDALENRLYKMVKDTLSDPLQQAEILKEYPKKTITRRNTGYAIDLLVNTAPFGHPAEPFNFCKLLAGSEGTLAFTTEIKLNLVALPPKIKAVVCVHFDTVDQALRGNLIALKFNPGACELMDNVILECTKENIEQQQNRFFVKGDPGAILIVEFARETREEIESLALQMETAMKSAGYGYHFPLIYAPDFKKVWDLRKAGLGVLANVPGDAKAVSFIEDTAVDVQDLPNYIAEFALMLKAYNLSCVYHAHAATGELHIRPILNLKDKRDVAWFKEIGEKTALLVKKYNGSLSGEHGDGRLRGQFIRLMIGEKNYELIKSIKKTWDPKGIFNPGKIVNTPEMNTSLRYAPGMETPQFKTVFSFAHDNGILRAAERCNGSGDCRKSELIGGTMCPSFMATKNEKDTTRARANILRNFLTNSEKINKFDHEEIKQVMDLCISCKGCKNECPSNVDMATLKAEFLQHYYDANGVSFRSRMIGNFNKANKLASALPGLNNFLFSNSFTSGIAKKILGIAPKRNFPLLHTTTLETWAKKNLKGLNPKGKNKGKVFLFCDEFTNFNDTEIGIKAIKLLTGLGYEVEIPKHEESGRTFLSKGLVREAQKIAIKNVKLLKDRITASAPLLGIEPSGILGFRDEYPNLVPSELFGAAQTLSKNCLLIDEFIAREMDAGNILPEQFTHATKKIKLHGHCHQKALSSVVPSKKMLSFPTNYSVEMIPSGCCGMAGSFGYEKEHYDISMKIGELVLFPAVRKAAEDTIIAAPGTSCRHQIKDGTGRQAKHTIEVLFEAML